MTSVVLPVVETGPEALLRMSELTVSEDGEFVAKDPLACSSGQRIIRFDDRYYHAVESSHRVAQARARIDTIRHGVDPDADPRHINARWNVSTFVEDKPVKVTVELPGPLHRDLATYAEVLARETGQPAADPVRLIVPMLERFIATDRGFTKARRSVLSPKSQV